MPSVHPRDTIPAPSPFFADVTQVDFDLPDEWPPPVDEDDGWSIPLHDENLDEM